ncbi:hypothetical protein N431DRAFT_468918 [Stipitochalara longipes BDJ]|nr:hypothetical protein N431DRAFT_468918 [Stipitochalara longipes BDJ]
MSTEDTLANIPTDQLILKLLQELAVRVEKLEKKDEAGGEQDPYARKFQVGNSRDNPAIAINEPNTTESASVASEAEDGSSLCQTCGGLQGDSCHCVEVPYGYLLEGETPSENMKTVKERVDELKLSDQGKRHLLKLERLGVAAVPADGRLDFTNFWSPTTSSDLQEATEWAGAILVNGGVFSVTDFDCDGNYTIYGPGEDITGMARNLGDASTRKFRVPPIRFNPKIQYSAPWNRLILISGLSAFDRHPLFFVVDIISPWAVNTHLKLYESFHGLRTYSGARAACPRTNTRLFHLYGYEVGDERYGNTIWKQGVLPGKTKWLLQRAHTIATIYHDSIPFWTLVVLLPLPGSEAMGIESHIQTTACKDLPLVIVMADAIFCILESTWEGWRTLVRYIDEEVLGAANEIFDVEAHDDLIFDDDLYTRSRRYFWAINCVNESLNLLRRNIQVWTEHRDDVLLPLGRKLHSVEMKEFDNTIRNCNEVQAKLLKIEETFNEQRTKLVALRDGLFSASAVMESRASTRLGENVKLLTYVSIFYLPLAFCTSIWSTTDTFGYRNLAITMIVIGILTYLIVFNLNLIVSFSKSSYSSLKIGIISSMQADSRKGWGERGELFHKYRPRENADQTKPSEWWIMIYLLRRVLDVVSFRKEELSERETKKGKRKWYGRLLWRGKKEGREPTSQLDEASNSRA